MTLYHLYMPLLHYIIYLLYHIVDLDYWNLFQVEQKKLEKVFLSNLYNQLHFDHETNIDAVAPLGLFQTTIYLDCYNFQFQYILIPLEI